MDIRFTEMNDNQRRILIDTSQLYEAWMSAWHKRRTLRGGMHWKQSKGHHYLFRTRNRLGYGKSLGPRNANTEEIYARFQKARQEAQQRLDTLKARLKEQSRFCKAVSLQRVPRLVTSILRCLEQHHLLGKNVVVIGTNAIYGYETAAGVFAERPVLATCDLDICWDTRARLKLAHLDEKPERTGLLDLLQKVDQSFQTLSGYRFRAVNQDGYMVDLVKPEPRPAIRREPFRMGDAGDLEAAEIPNLQWLLATPKFAQTVIGDDGWPALMVTPDPRAFALHKIWLSKQTARDPLKKSRDRHQGLTVAALVYRYLPQYPFSARTLKMFPHRLFLEAMQILEEVALPNDFENQ